MLSIDCESLLAENVPARKTAILHENENAAAQSVLDSSSDLRSFCAALNGIGSPTFAARHPTRDEIGVEPPSGSLRGGGAELWIIFSGNHHFIN
jgi:hypothetical protein